MIQVQGKRLPWRENMTVADLLADLDEHYHYAVVRINGRTVSSPDFGDTVIPDEAEIFLVPMIAGG